MSLENKIKSEIKNNGFVTLDRFIEICLYDVESGYYIRNNPIGKRGDYITSPEISQLFGELLGLYIIDYWNNYIRSEFALIELGPGKGTLMKDLLRISKEFKEFYKLINLKLVEKNKKLELIQKKLLKVKSKDVNNIEWLEDIKNINNDNFIIIANEFFDCFPVKQFTKINGQYYEKIVKYNEYEEKFFFDKIIIKDNIKNIVADIFKIRKFHEGDILEISFEKDNYLKTIGNKLKCGNGLLIIIDYGDYFSKGKSTIQSFYSHKLTNFLDNPGTQDLTHKIDFSSIKKIFTDMSLKVYGPFTQKNFLESIGIEERKNQILQNSSSDLKKDLIDGYNKIINKDEMGEIFKVLIVSTKKINLYEK
ncbi:MAG: hypothetical protein CFH21_01113 [Alphaproteobacteria bacterium MarineAlpha5_Bin11]|nr:MAG: hypothetical protein CFH21_01113 [Alphaproteobacteria bacterium MarineAlpha5_Bin11]PPR50469.1 MAG: hypothetical protein CFH20_00928 [Alphaproteobacteria bacterium MarineAlpha5_Bin10]